jgi:hypothetical protein
MRTNILKSLMSINILVSILNLLELFHMLLVIYLRKLAKLCFVSENPYFQTELI